ncbi:MAG: FG-GAP-like repeat-containing protein [Calditrichia bacterium]
MSRLAFFLILSFYANLFSQQLFVTNVLPAQNSNSGAASTTIEIAFNLPVDTTDIAQNIIVTGNESSLMHFRYHTGPSGLTIYLVPQSNFLSGEKVKVCLTHSIKGINGEEFDGYEWDFRVQPSLPTHPYFASPVIYSQFGGFYLESADVDDDNAPDLMFSHSILRNDGLGNFSLFQLLDPDDGSGKPLLFDFDLDGFKDLWISPYFYEQGNDGLFHYDTTIYRGIRQIRDMNRDGFPDFIICESLGQQDTLCFIGIYYNKGQFKPLAQIDTVVTEKRVRSITTGDFNNDGVEDIAYCTTVFATPSGVSGHNSIRVLYMSSTGDTLYRNIYNENDFPSVYVGMPFDIQNADFNNDGYLDILLMTNSDDFVIFNDTQGGFDVNSAAITGGGDFYHASTMGDINGNGWLDLIYNGVIGAGENAHTFYAQNSNAQFNSGFLIYEKDTAYVYNSAIADFNGDGALDVASTWGDGLYIHFNTKVNKLDSPDKTHIEEFTLAQNYPNPFNPQTMIRYFTPASGNVRLTIYNLPGQEIITLQDGFQPAGEHQVKWNGVNSAGQKVASGIYFYELRAGKVRLLKKMMLGK